MNKSPALAIHTSSLGDVLCATPTIRKLREIYGQKVYVISGNKEVLENNPNISRNLSFDEADLNQISDSYDLHQTFRNLGKRDESGVEFKHAICDIRQFHAKDLGFMLTSSELSCEFYPSLDSKMVYDTLGLPSSYVVIHPVQSWESRTWGRENWQALCDFLYKENIFVVAIGKNGSENSDHLNQEKPTFNLDIKFGLDLANQTDLSTSWRILKNSECVVTMDSGILHLSGTTDSYIVQLGSSIDPKFRAPYRRGTQGYKYEYILGECSIHCASDMRYSLRDWGGIQNVTLISTCLEPGKNFSCKPNPEKVLDRVRIIMGKSEYNYRDLYSNLTKSDSF